MVTFIRTDLTPTQMVKLQEEACSKGLELTISSLDVIKKNSLIIVVVYRFPGVKAAWFDAFNAILLKIVHLGQLVIMGDLNADLSKSTIQPGKSLRSSLKLAGDRVESTKPTRIQGNSSTCSIL